MDDIVYRYKVDRQPQSDQEIQEKLGINESSDSLLLLNAKKKFLGACNCSKNRLLNFVTGLFPIFTWLKSYDKTWIPGDIVAGLTVGVVHIPQSLAFSILAGLAPVFGLYTSFYPVLIYTLMGTSRHISVGTFAVTSLMTQAVVFRHYPPSLDDNTIANSTAMNASSTTMMPMNGSDGLLTELDMKRAGVAAAVALITGIFQLLFGMVRLGFITSYLSEPVIQGFTTGAALQVVTSQTPPALGITIQRFNGPLSFYLSWIDIFRNFPNIHVATLVITIVCIILLTIGREINIRYKEKLKMPIPSEVILVVIAILASHFGNFKQRFSVTVVDNVPTGLPPPQVPDVSILGSIIGDGFAIAVVGFAISVSLSKLYATRHGYKIDPNQELIAYGAANLVPSFFLCFPSAAALARCEIQDNTGGRTQIVGVISVIIVLIVVLALGPIFEPLPRAVLACIIIVGLFGIIAQMKNLKTMYKTSKIDFIVWIITLLAVVSLGVGLGLLVGVIFAIATIVARTQIPRFEVLSNIEDTDIYRAKGKYKNQKDPNGIIIIKMHTSLYYANKDFFKNKLLTVIGFDPSDVIANRKAAQEVYAKKSVKQDNSRTSFHWMRKQPKEVVEGNGNAISIEVEETRENDEWLPPIHTIIVDCASFGFIDYAGGKLIGQLYKSFQQLQISFVLANCNDDVRGQLVRSGFMENVGKDATFVSIHDAVVYSLSSKTTVEQTE